MRNVFADRDVQIIEQFEVSSSKQYSRFQIHKYNRDISESNFRNIMQFADRCNLSDLYFTVLSPDFFVSDGQHRVLAMESLGHSVFYRNSSKATVDDVARCNELTVKYSIQDAMRGFSHLGIDSYVEAWELSKGLKHITKNRLASISLSANGDKMGHFYMGMAKFSQGNYVRHVDDCIEKMVEVAPVLGNRRYKECLAHLLRFKSFDFDRLLKSKGKLNELPEIPDNSEAAYLLLEGAYNFNYSNRLSFLDNTNNRDFWRDYNEPPPTMGLASLPERNIDSVKSVQIYSTMDYAAFKRHPAFRVQPKSNVEKLAKSLLLKNLLDCYPIIVDKDFFVLDGWKRLRAAESIGAPIFFVVADAASPLMLLIAQSLQQAWRADDYLKTYSEQGYASYLNVRTFKKMYPFLSLGMCIKSLSNNTVGVQDFRRGKMICEDSERAFSWAGHISGIEDSKVKKSRSFQNYTHRHFVGTDMFSLPKLVSNVNKYGIHIFGGPKTSREWKEAILVAHDYRRKNKVFSEPQIENSNLIDIQGK